MGKVYTKISFLLLAVVCCCGCESMLDSFDDFVDEALGIEPSHASKNKSREVVDRNVVATWWDGPKVRPGIGLVIAVGNAGMPMTTMNVMVDQKGEITLSLLLQKPVACDGLTLEELKQKLVAEYGVYYRQPQVTVTFAPWDGGGVSPWGTITVMGQVGNPGPVNMPATMDMTVTRALQAAGGLKSYGNRNRICVTRCDRFGKQTRYKVDLDEIGEDGRPDKDMVLRAGDVVWVPEVLF